MNLNTRIRIERPVITADPVYGGEVTTWALVGLAWAEVVDKLPSRDEGLLDVITLSSIRARVRLRYRTDIDASCRFIIMRPDPATWQIIGGPAMVGNREAVEFLCEKKSS